LAGLLPAAGLGCVEVAVLAPVVLGAAAALALAAVAVALVWRRRRAAEIEARKTEGEREREAVMWKLRAKLRITANEGSVSFPV
jgi:hypothetical protein